METCICLWQYLFEFFLEWGIFQTEGVEKIKKKQLLNGKSTVKTQLYLFATSEGVT
jgi:hypothetical protein